MKIKQRLLLAGVTALACLCGLAIWMWVQWPHLMLAYHEHMIIHSPMASDGGSAIVSGGSPVGAIPELCHNYPEIRHIVVTKLKNGDYPSSVSAYLFVRVVCFLHTDEAFTLYREYLDSENPLLVYAASVRLNKASLYTIQTFDRALTPREKSSILEALWTARARHSDTSLRGANLQTAIADAIRSVDRLTDTSRSTDSGLVIPRD